jgi:hypothetical protein
VVILVIDISELLAVVVAHDETRGSFLDGPRRREAALPTQSFCNNSGSLAMFVAIRRASSLLSSLAAERRPGSSSK